MPDRPLTVRLKAFAALAVALVVSACGNNEDGTVDATSALPSVDDFPAGWEVLKEVENDDHPYEQVVVDCVVGTDNVEDVAGVNTAYGLRSAEGTVSASAYPVAVMFATEEAATKAVAKVVSTQFTDCLDDAAFTDPAGDSAPFFRGTFTYIGSDIVDQAELDRRDGDVDEAVYFAVDFEVEPMPDGPQVSVWGFGFYVLRDGPLVQVTRMATETSSEADDVLDAAFAAFRSDEPQ